MTDDPDPRVCCTECRHYTGSQCRQWRAAGLMTPHIGGDLARLRQWCPAFVAKPEPRP
jgi:hypothetical protein